MARPNMIRTNIIEPNRAELEQFGDVACVASNVPMPNGGYKKTTAYYLNEEQALLVATLSRTEKARQVRAMLIRVSGQCFRPILACGLPQNEVCATGPDTQII